MKPKLLSFAIIFASMAAALAGQLPAPTAPTNLRIGDEPIWGVSAPEILGSCSQAAHDAHSLSGGDGFRYRTWHPQVDPTGCIYAHEHGDNPNAIQNFEIAAQPVLFGYVGRRMPMPSEPNGHQEPHEGFKVFVANPGDVNDEYRVNRVYSRSVFHMGTGGPGRFTNRFHSADIRLVHPEFGLKAFTRLMMDTGGTATVCDPRVPAPTKDVIQLGSPCLLDSLYEIWSTQQIVRYQGREVYRAFATPAVFDPITVFDPANPTRVLYTFDPLVNGIMRFPNNSRSDVRGCDRESYAQPGYWYNGGSSGRDIYYTDTLGNELAASNPLAIAQTISRSNSVGAPATNDGLIQFKVRRSWCQRLSNLGLKN